MSRAKRSGCRPRLRVCSYLTHAFHSGPGESWQPANLALSTVLALISLAAFMPDGEGWWRREGWRVGDPSNLAERRDRTGPERSVRLGEERRLPSVPLECPHSHPPRASSPPHFNLRPKGIRRSMLSGHERMGYLIITHGFLLIIN